MARRERVVRRNTQKRKSRRTRRTRRQRKQRGGSQMPPTFHVLIASGGRSSLKGMLDSLRGELKAGDAVTVVFDGAEAQKLSGYSPSWAEGFAAKVTVKVEAEKTGNWGHKIRNKYRTGLEPATTFLMHADDDDEYIAGFAAALREACKDPKKLYIAKMRVEDGGQRVIPSQDKEIRFTDIGTPCGIIPFGDADKAEWVSRYGGDFDYFNTLGKALGPERVQFLPNIIYKVHPNTPDAGTVGGAAAAAAAAAPAPAATPSSEGGEKHTAVIVEPRKSAALQLVLRNALDNLGPEWNILIFHSKGNDGWLKDLLKKDFAVENGGNRIQTQILENGDGMTQMTYSNMLKTRAFYEKIPTEMFLIFQTDSLICAPHKDLLKKFMSYDYVGAPWATGGVGNGGLSLRRKSKILEFIDKCPPNDKWEDMFFADLHNECKAVTLKKPGADEAAEFSIETRYTPKSFGIHKAWAYNPGKIEELEKQCPGIKQLQVDYTRFLP